MAAATLQSILDAAAIRCSYDPADRDYFSGADLSGTELLNICNDVAAEVIDRFDARALSVVVYLTSGGEAVNGTRVVEAPNGSTLTESMTALASGQYILPSYVHHVHRAPDAVVDLTMNRRPVVALDGFGQWSALKTRGQQAQRYYRVFGDIGAGRIEFYGPLPAGQQIVIACQTDRWLRTGGPAGSYASAPASGDDAVLIPRRAMEAGIVAEYRRRRGLAFTDERDIFDMTLARWLADTRPMQAVSIMPTNQRAMFPDDVPDIFPKGPFA